MGDSDSRRSGGSDSGGEDPGAWKRRVLQLVAAVGAALLILVATAVGQRLGVIDESTTSLFTIIVAVLAFIVSGEVIRKL